MLHYETLHPASLELLKTLMSQDELHDILCSAVVGRYTRSQKQIERACQRNEQPEKLPIRHVKEECQT